MGRGEDARSVDARAVRYTRPVSEPAIQRLARPLSAVTPDERREWEREFDAASRRPLRQRFRYAFIRTYKPVLDDARFRAFATTREYREWCEQHLPGFLGYGRSV